MKSVISVFNVNVLREKNKSGIKMSPIKTKITTIYTESTSRQILRTVYAKQLLCQQNRKHKERNQFYVTQNFT